MGGPGPLLGTLGGERDQTLDPDVPAQSDRETDGSGRRDDDGQVGLARGREQAGAGLARRGEECLVEGGQVAGTQGAAHPGHAGLRLALGVLRLPGMASLLEHLGPRVRSLREPVAARAPVGPRQLHRQHASVDDVSWRLQHGVDQASYDVGTRHSGGVRHDGDRVGGHPEDRHGSPERAEVHPGGDGALTHPDVPHVGGYRVLRDGVVPRRGVPLLRRALSLQQEQQDRRLCVGHDSQPPTGWGRRHPKGRSPRSGHQPTVVSSCVARVSTT